MSYAIHIQQHYYANALNAPRSGLMRSDYEGDIIAVATLDEAQRLLKMLDWEPSGPAYLDQNQYARAEYSIRESTAEPHSMEWAMNRLSLQYDFLPSGEKIELTERDLFGGA